MTRVHPQRSTAAVLGALVVMVLLTGCSDERPAPEAWRTTWDGVRNQLPALETVIGDPDQGVCSDTLAMLREETPSLSPTPDLAIDDVVRDWIEIAEDAFFECPPRGEEIDSFEKAYAELERLEAEVAVVLELDTTE